MFYFKIIPSTFSFEICLFWCKYQLVAICFKIATNKDLEDRVNIIGYLVQSTLLMLRGDENSNLSKRKKKNYSSHARLQRDYDLPVTKYGH